MEVAVAPKTLQEAFETLEFRFLSDMPQDELRNSARLFFNLEQAWWFYEDSLADAHSYLPHYNRFLSFCRALFQVSPTLRPLLPNMEKMYEEFCDYKWKIPVYGCAYLTDDLSKVLLVRGYNQSTWGLPKGKVNQDEDELTCALREAYEETGYDATALRPNKNDVLVWHQKRQHGAQTTKKVTIFIVPGVPEDFPFHPVVNKEIDEAKWFKVSDIPMPGTEASKIFWGVAPFITALRTWISHRKKGKQAVGSSLVTEDDISGSASEEFTVEEMFRVNRVLRDKELQAEKQKSKQKQPIAKAATQLKPSSKPGKESSEKRKPSKNSVDQVTRVPFQERVQDTSDDEFTIRWESVAAAMAPYLNRT